MVSTNGAEHISGFVSIDISIMSTNSIAPSVVEESPGMSMNMTISEGWSNEMPGTDVAHHVCGLSVLSVIPEVGVSGDTTLAPVGTVVSGWLPGESIGES